MAALLNGLCSFGRTLFLISQSSSVVLARPSTLNGALRDLLKNQQLLRRAEGGFGSCYLQVAIGTLLPLCDYVSFAPAPSLSAMTCDFFDTVT